jgi:hypothetical protein
MTESEFPVPESDDSALQSSDSTASLEDQAWISGLLGTLRATDEPIPNAVAERLDKALQLESAAASTDITPIAVNHRPARGTRWLAIAAAAAVLIGGTAVYRQATTTEQTGSSVASSETQASESAPITPTVSTALGTADAAATRVIDGSAVTTSKDTVGSSITAVLTAINANGGGTAAGGSAGGSANVGSVTTSIVQPVPTPTSSVEGLKTQPWSDCLAAIAGVSGAGPSAVITGITYQGQQADVLVRNTDATHVEVWVIAIGCSAAKTDLLDHEVIAA